MPNKIPDPVIVIDRRERKPYSFANVPRRHGEPNHPQEVKTVTRTLTTGDYSIVGLEDEIAVERKSPQDLFGTLGQHRARFEREIQRLNQMRYAAVVIEADWSDLMRPQAPALDERRAFRMIDDALQHASDEQVRSAMDTVGDWFVDRWRSLPKRERWRSRLNPVSVWGTVFAWSQRYPRVHWFPVSGRRFGEWATYTILQRYWIDNHRQKGFA